MAEKYDMTTKITALVLEQCEEPVPMVVEPATQFSDLGLDWMAHMQLIMSIEEEFNVIISDEEAQELVSVQAVLAYLHKQTGY